MTYRRRRRALADLEALGLTPAPRGEAGPGVAAGEPGEEARGPDQEELMYALDRNAPVPGGPGGRPEPDGDRLARIEFIARRIAAVVAAIEVSNESLSARVSALEKERDLFKARFGAVVWVLGFIFSGLVMGALSIWNGLRDIFR
jgi:hypothetical protein